MRISPEHIKTKTLAGKTKEGEPILYIESKGGLHAFFVKKQDGDIESVGASPHKGISQFFAEKKCPGIEWDEDFINKSELIKSELDQFNRIRDMIFAPVPEEPIPDNGMFFVYHPVDKTIEVLERSETIDRLKEDGGNLYVRPVNLSKSVDVGSWALNELINEDHYRSKE